MLEAAPCERTPKTDFESRSAAPGRYHDVAGAVLHVFKAVKTRRGAQPMATAGQARRRGCAAARDMRRRPRSLFRAWQRQRCPQGVRVESLGAGLGTAGVARRGAAIPWATPRHRYPGHFNG